jgi:hypothetical protein
VWHPERTVRARTCISSATTRPGAVWAKEDEEGALSESRCRRRDACCCTVDGCVGVQHCQERRRTGRKERHHGVRHNIRDDVEANEYFALKRNSICNRRVPRSRLVHRSLQLLLQSRHVLARLRPGMYFKMPKCQNVGDSEVSDPKLATRKDAKIGEIVDYRRWGSAVGTPPLSYSSVAHFLPSD